MFLTEVRRFNDEDLYAWATSLLTELKEAGKSFTAHYIGYGHWTLGRVQNDLIVKSGLTVIFCFDYTLDEQKKDIIRQIDSNTDAKLLWIGAEKQPFDHPRIKSVFWPADMLLQNKQYKRFDDMQKDPAKSKHWISTSLGIRPHRIYAASLIKGLGLDTHGDLRIKTVSQSGKKSPLVSDELFKGNGYAPDETPSLPLYVENKWGVKEQKENISVDAAKGYETLIKRKWWGSDLFLFSDYMALGFDQNNNAKNFDKNLRHLYKDKTLELVNETSHRYDPVFVTEKFINAVVGLNFVVMNGPAGSVQLLEDLGWNSCRHVINHDYDNIESPILRCEQAIRLNLKLFNDTEYCNHMWQNNIHILKHNSQWARERLYDKVLKICTEEIKSGVNIGF